MEEYIYYNNLYDCYYKLLTKKQCKYFEDYYFSNLSLGEIAENYDVSRNAVYKQIQITKQKLIEYESNLELYKKKTIIEKLYEEVKDNKIKEELKKLI